MQKILMMVYVLFSVSGVVCFKLGSSITLAVELTNTFFSIKISWLSVAGLALYVISFLIYMVLVSKNDLSYLVPVMTGAVYLMTLLSSVVIFKENLQFLHVVGSALILIGLVLMNCKVSQ